MADRECRCFHKSATVQSFYHATVGSLNTALNMNIGILRLSGIGAASNLLMQRNRCAVLFFLGFILGLAPLRLNAVIILLGSQYIWDETDQHAPGLAGYNGRDCETNSVGMARWWVSEPYCTLWLEDEP